MAIRPRIYCCLAVRQKKYFDLSSCSASSIDLNAMFSTAWIECTYFTTSIYLVISFDKCTYFVYSLTGLDYDFIALNKIGREEKFKMN